MNFRLPSKVLDKFELKEDGKRYVELNYGGPGDKVSKELLSLHLAVAQVSNAIGAGEVEWIYDDEEEEPDLRYASDDPIRFVDEMDARLSCLNFQQQMKV